MSQIIPKKSSVIGKAPASGDLVTGEIALNIADKLLFFKDHYGHVNSLTVASVSGSALPNPTSSSKGGVVSSVSYVGNEFVKGINESGQVVFGELPIAYFDYAENYNPGVLSSLDYYKLTNLQNYTLPVAQTSVIGGVRANAGSAGQYVSGVNTSTGALIYTTLPSAVLLTDNQTVAGNKTFTGQMELTGQAATTATSALTRSIGDTRYRRNPMDIDSATKAKFQVIEDWFTFGAAPWGVAGWYTSVSSNGYVAFGSTYPGTHRNGLVLVTATATDNVARASSYVTSQSGVLFFATASFGVAGSLRTARTRWGVGWSDQQDSETQFRGFGVNNNTDSLATGNFMWMVGSTMIDSGLAIPSLPEQERLEIRITPTDPVNLNALRVDVWRVNGWEAQEMEMTYVGSSEIGPSQPSPRNVTITAPFNDRPRAFVRTLNTTAKAITLSSFAIRNSRIA
jgi:hypothetical protein